ncbi:hypothetical protein TNCV_5012591 [Trichonephila clavipes]|nr:hypothetical protein TNCV_5012591 [Trichonephila clavipes]
MVKGVPAPIDNRRSLSKKNTVASADGKRMNGSKDQRWCDKQRVQIRSRYGVPLDSRRAGSVFVCSARIGH